MAMEIFIWTSVVFNTIMFIAIGMGTCRHDLLNFVRMRAAGNAKYLGGANLIIGTALSLGAVSSIKDEWARWRYFIRLVKHGYVPAGSKGGYDRGGHLDRINEIPLSMVPSLVGHPFKNARLSGSLLVQTFKGGSETYLFVLATDIMMVVTLVDCSCDLKGTISGNGVKADREDGGTRGKRGIYYFSS
ncbi:hypothetical protein EV363DRAFT_1299841 [Boletus edulis]|nr:hypothetical protein EV363DRAFT_1299841 [Boletus edulis]